MTATPSDAVQEWQRHLDRLELELEWTERLLLASRAVDAWGWDPPETAGPLPRELLPRARAIHARQLALIERLVPALQQSHREQAFIELAALPGPGHPRYVDVTA